MKTLLTICHSERHDEKRLHVIKVKHKPEELHLHWTIEVHLMHSAVLYSCSRYPNYKLASQVQSSQGGTIHQWTQMMSCRSYSFELYSYWLLQNNHSPPISVHSLQYVEKHPGPASYKRTEKKRNFHVIKNLFPSGCISVCTEGSIWYPCGSIPYCSPKLNM